SRKRAERTIKPSLPGTSTASSAQESSRRDAVVRATDAETALRKLRLEIILFSQEPLNLNSAKLEQIHVKNSGSGPGHDQAVKLHSICRSICRDFRNPKNPGFALGCPDFSGCRICSCEVRHKSEREARESGCHW